MKEAMEIRGRGMDDDLSRLVITRVSPVVFLEPGIFEMRIDCRWWCSKLSTSPLPPLHLGRPQNDSFRPWESAGQALLDVHAT